MALKYVPTQTLTIGDTSGLEDVCAVATVEQAITNKIPGFKFVLANTDGRYNDEWDWGDIVSYSILETQVLQGFIDTVTPNVVKNKYLIDIHGRGTAGKLDDIIDSIYQITTPRAIVELIFDRYNNVRKLSEDPEITIAENQTPEDIQARWVFKRLSFWEALTYVCNWLSAPEDWGGMDYPYDMWVNIENKYFLVKCGYYPTDPDTMININYGTEYLEWKRPKSGLDIVNDVWAWGGEGGGRIPLEMQPNYCDSGLLDPWTEDNAEDFKAGPEVEGGPNNSGDYSIIGDFSVWWKTTTTPKKQSYIYMNFPFPDDESKWPSQDPAGGMNTFNETRMHETMGEISRLEYFLRVDKENKEAYATCDHYIEVVEGSSPPTIIRSTYDVNNCLDYKLAPNGWNFFSWEFGPSASNYTWVTEPVTNEFGWHNISEIRFVMYDWSILDSVVPQVLGGINVYLDGLSFVKPLVVNIKDESDKKRKSKFYTNFNISEYLNLKAWATAILERTQHPQFYYDFENLGRVDIPVGYMFKLGGVNLVMREIIYNNSKTEGFTVKGLGYRAT